MSLRTKVVLKINIAKNIDFYLIFGTIKVSFQKKALRVINI